MRSVVITGVGVVSPVGVGKEPFVDALEQGRSGVRPITHFDASEFTTRFAAYIDEFDPSATLNPKEARRMARFQQFAVVAADEAVADAGLEFDETEADRIGVIVGSGIGGLHVMEEQKQRLMEGGPRKVSPFLVPMMIVDLAAGLISIRLGAKGINYAPVSACATGSHAIGEGTEAIRRGQADVVVAGGVDAAITPLGVAGFAAARALSTRNDEPARASRPFDAGRDGFVMGEGCGVVVLEERERAVARGARIYGEVVGYGATGDAYHITAPEPSGDGAVRAMLHALEQSGLAPADIGYINAHGTSTPQGDVIETRAVKTVFGTDAPPVSSTKSMTGHLLGGAGAVEAVVCALVLERDFLPPTINLDEPDPECDLDYVANAARRQQVDAVMTNSFGFGGHNATLIIARG
ncbi:MAG: beta-ketoacyl-ACP synthase II [Anaerosomatales bacterium]|nr:beta-ketoacyl-ACP synthase II [Anaerosomatales bacterium]MDT8433410.1 beta-ketoacyl-ACP synthase II [Anaerosomatales bacterium]